MRIHHGVLVVLLASLATGGAAFGQAIPTSSPDPTEPDANQDVPSKAVPSGPEPDGVPAPPPVSDDSADDPPVEPAPTPIDIRPATIEGELGVEDTVESSAPQLIIGGFAQPQFRLRQNDPVAQEDEDGFRLRRTRLTVAAAQPGELISFYFALEAEFTPEFQLLDAVISGVGDLPHGGRLRVDLGQIRPPMSQQNLASAAELQFVERALLTEIVPARQLGAGFQLNVPAAPWLEVSGGVFNGEGRNQIQNIDEKYMYVGRVAFRPIGTFATRTESALGEDQISVAGSAAFLNSAIESEGKTLWLGADAFASWNGISGYVEYVWRQTEFDEGVAQTDFNGNGINVQAGYLLPIPGWFYRKLEVAARFEEFDRNDAIPIEQRGDTNQSLRSYVLGLSYYHAGHDVKAQLAVTHTTEVEDIDRGLMDATFDNDTVLFQLTYRLK